MVISFWFNIVITFDSPGGRYKTWKPCAERRRIKNSKLVSEKKSVSDDAANQNGGNARGGNDEEQGRIKDIKQKRR